MNALSSADVLLVIALLLGEAEFRLAWSCTRASRGHGSGYLRSAGRGQGRGRGWRIRGWAVGGKADSSHTSVEGELVEALLGYAVPLASTTRVVVALCRALVIAKASTSAALFFHSLG